MNHYFVIIISIVAAFLITACRCEKVHQSQLHVRKEITYHSANCMDIQNVSVHSKCLTCSQQSHSSQLLTELKYDTCHYRVCLIPGNNTGIGIEGCYNSTDLQDIYFQNCYLRWRYVLHKEYSSSLEECHNEDITYNIMFIWISAVLIMFILSMCGCCFYLWPFFCWYYIKKTCNKPKVYGLLYEGKGTMNCKCISFSCFSSKTYNALPTSDGDLEMVESGANFSLVENIGTGFYYQSTHVPFLPFCCFKTTDYFLGKRDVNQQLWSRVSAFKKYRTGINDLYESLQAKSLETISSFDFIETSKNNFDPDMRQQSKTHQVIKNVSELFEVAQKALPVFNKLLFLDVKNLVESKTRSALHCKSAPLKEVNRATEKAFNDYKERKDGPAEAWLYDICRGKFICSNYQQVFLIIEELEALFPHVIIIRLKNRFSKPTQSGYMDFNLNIKIFVPSLEVYHICELQIHLGELDKYEHDNDSHDDYEFFRSYYAGGEKDAVEERLALFEKIETHKLNQQGDLFAMVQYADTADDLKLLKSLQALFLSFSSDELCEKCNRGILRLSIIQKNVNAIEISNILLRIGRNLQNRQLEAEAERYFLKALEIRFSIYGSVQCRLTNVSVDDHAGYLETLQSLALLYKEQCRFEEAKKMYEECREISAKLYSKSSSQYADSLNDLGSLNGLMTSSNNNNAQLHDETLQLLQECLAIRMQVLGRAHLDTAETSYQIGLIFQLLGKREEAYEQFSTSLSMRNYVLTSAVDAAAELSLAQAVAEQSIKEHQKLKGKSYLVGLSHLSLGRALLDLGSYDKAKESLDIGLGILQDCVGPIHEKTIAAKYDRYLYFNMRKVWVPFIYLLGVHSIFFSIILLGIFPSSIFFWCLGNTVFYFTAYYICYSDIWRCPYFGINFFFFWTLSVASVKIPFLFSIMLLSCILALFPQYERFREQRLLRNINKTFFCFLFGFNFPSISLICSQLSEFVAFVIRNYRQGNGNFYAITTNETVRAAVMQWANKNTRLVSTAIFIYIWFINNSVELFWPI